MLNAARNLVSKVTGSGSQASGGDDPMDESNNDELMDETTQKMEHPVDEVKVKGYPVGPDLLCQLDIDFDLTHKKKQKKATRVPVLVLDCSGSMGNWVQRCLDSWNSGLTELGFGPDEDAHIIEFESGVTERKLKVKDLKDYRSRSRGGTSMTPVVMPLKKVISANMKNDIYLWVMSDGGIGDQARFRELFKQEMTDFMGSPNISVCGIRLTLGYNDPDTTAMCAVGLLSNNEFNLEDFTDGNNRGGYGRCEETSGSVGGLVELIMGITAAEAMLTLATGGGVKCLTKRPGEELSSSVEIRNKNYFLVRKPIGKLTLNGIPVIIEERPEEESLKVLERYAKVALHKLAQEKIAAVGECTDHFIQALENLFEKLDAKEASIDEDMGDIGSTKHRVHLLKKSLEKQKRGIRQQIAQLRNEAHMEQLSGNVQASFLKGIGMDSKADKALGRRYIATQTDPEKLIQEAVDVFVKEIDEIEKATEKADMPRCFVLQETSLESCITALKAAIEIFSNYGSLDVENCLQLLGLVGIAVKHKIDNFVEPMNLGINHGFRDKIVDIYPGVVLNQTSVWYAAKNSETLKAPGFNGEITSVVPIKKWNHPLVWKLYNSLTSIAVLQCSAQLRRMLTPLPRDRRAFAASALLKMLSMWPTPSEIQANTMADMLDSIQMYKTPEELAKLTTLLMEDKNPDHHFTDANAFNSELGPFALMMVDRNLLAFAGGPDSRLFWRALISNTTYWRTRKALGEDERQKELRVLFSISEEHYTHPLPDDVEEPDEPEYYAGWDATKMEEYTKRRNLRPRSRIFTRFHAIAKVYNKNGKITPEMFEAEATPREEFAKFVIGYDYNTFMELEVAKAVKMKGESDRFLKENEEIKAMRMPHVETAAEAKKRMEDMVKPIYKWEYMNEAGEKRRKVTEARLSKFLEDFTAMSLDDFSKGMDENIPNAAHPSVAVVVQKIAKDVDKVADVKPKLELLLLGKAKEHVWNRGAVNRSKSKSLLKLLTPLMDEKEKEEIRELIHKNTKHVYREQLNRQGHNNDKPSFWAITGNSQPWCFLSHDPVGYESFVNETLRGYENSELPSEQYLWETWKHLLTNRPSKERPGG